jgi:uncharacterized damage-inducible protein DinB
MQLIANEFIQCCIHQLEENTPKIKKCLDELTEEEVWKKPNASSNSVGNQLLHLCGNITQWILSSLGDTPDQRERDLEFSTEGGLTKKELFDKLESTVSNAIKVIQSLTGDELLQLRSVQGYQHSGVGIIIHVVEHYSYHTGQIIFWTKLQKNKDMDFYAGVDLNKKNG